MKPEDDLDKLYNDEGYKDGYQDGYKEGLIDLKEIIFGDINKFLKLSGASE